MEIRRVWAVYYSATGTTDRAVNTVAEELAARLELPLERVPFTRPAERAADHAFTAEDLVVVGSPTYAGRLPNKIAPDFRRALRGGGALAVPLVLFGNRSYDNALAELAALLAENGFRPVAAGAFVGRHAFTDKLGEGRPDWDDRAELRRFAGEIAEKFSISQPSVSRHLDVLKQAEIVTAERRGNQIIYSLNLSVMQEMYIQLTDLLTRREEERYECP